MDARYMSRDPEVMSGALCFTGTRVPVQNLFDYLEGTSSLEEFLQDFPSVSRRMLKKSASGVLASLRGSTYRSVRLASSLAAALLDGLFEHPEVILALAPYGKSNHIFGINQVFPQPAREAAAAVIEDAKSRLFADAIAS